MSIKELVSFVQNEYDFLLDEYLPNRFAMLVSKDNKWGVQIDLGPHNEILEVIFWRIDNYVHKSSVGDVLDGLQLKHVLLDDTALKTEIELCMDVCFGLNPKSCTKFEQFYDLEVEM